MKLWAVVEDYYDGHPHEDNNEYENNLCCLYETKEEAEKHISDGIIMVGYKFPNGVIDDVYELVQEKEDRFVYEDNWLHDKTKVRRIVQIETGVFYKDPRAVNPLSWYKWDDEHPSSNYYDWVNYDD